MTDNVPGRDSLEGFRGLRPPELRRALSAGNAEPSKEDGKYARMVLGIAAEKLMIGVASTPEVGKVMLALVQRAEADAKDSMQKLLALPDPTTAEGRELHFTARVAAQVITYLNNFIVEGQSSARELAENDGEE